VVVSDQAPPGLHQPDNADHQEQTGHQIAAAGIQAGTGAETDFDSGKGRAKSGVGASSLPDGATKAEIPVLRRAPPRCVFDARKRTIARCCQGADERRTRHRW